MDKDNIIKLNLVMTYPIRWTIQHIMEDYIQNFYDVSGAENFSKEFIYEYDRDMKLLQLKSRKGFSLDWLKYIGVSTKKANNLHHQAGKFGEGFKIASLCAYRDYHISVHMESRDWMIDVICVPGNIDGEDVEFLGYDVRERPYAENSELSLGNIDRGAYEAFRLALKCFYYPENPVFGDCIVKTPNYAVYRLNPDETSRNNLVYGKVFASMQERGKIRYVPMVFCNHIYEPDREDDRDRREFTGSDTERAVAGIVSELEGEPLREVFMAFQSYWCRPDSTVKFGPDWSWLIRKMIYKIAYDDSILPKVYNFLKEDYIADIDSYAVRYDRNRYRTALSWFRSSEYHGRYRILPYYFSDLGIDTLYTLCERHDGFHIIHEPDEQQKGLIRILERVALDIFSDMICYEKLPKCRVIVNKETPDEGFARVAKNVQPIRNMLGLKVVHTITEINLRKELFSKNMFSKAVAVYMHELLHQFGTDTCMQFRTVILTMDYRIMESSEQLELYEEKWHQLF